MGISTFGIEGRISDVARAINSAANAIKGVVENLKATTHAQDLASLPRERIVTTGARHINSVLEPFCRGRNLHFSTEKIGDLHYYAHVGEKCPSFVVAVDDSEDLLYVNRLEVFACVCSALNWTPTMLLLAIESKAHALERLASCSE